MKKSFFILGLFFLLFLGLFCSPSAHLREFMGQHTSWASAREASLLKKNGDRVRIAVYSGEGTYDKSITASVKMFQWMGADAQRITPAEIGEGKLARLDVL
ncbi:MAG: hypothetical protein ABSB32_06715 [Thermodesulfobacteriota bacterium]|jgi:hypothetical protein